MGITEVEDLFNTCFFQYSVYRCPRDQLQNFLRLQPLPMNVAQQEQSDVKLKPPACMRIKFLSERLVITDTPTQGTSQTESKLERYVAECIIKTISQSALDF